MFRNIKNELKVISEKKNESKFKKVIQCKKDPFTNNISQDIKDFSNEFKFVHQKDITYDLTVDQMLQIYPENILTQQQFDIIKTDCFRNREYLSEFNFEYNFLREIDILFSIN